MKTLKDYLRDYSAWVDSGAPDMQPFLRSVGLCHNVRMASYTEDEQEIIQRELKDKLIADFGTSAYPFIGDTDSCHEPNCHLNPKRIEWVRRTLRSQWRYRLNLNPKRIEWIKHTLEELS